MKKIRVLIMLLVVLLIPCLLFVACNDDEDDKKDCSEGHTWKNASNPKRQKLVQSRTCVLPEIRERECKVCGTTEEYVSDDPTGHMYNPSKKIYLNDATCTANGHTVSHCYWYERCGYEADLIEEVLGSATGHKFLNYVPSVSDPMIGVAKCSDCDATDTSLLGIKLDMEGDRSHLSYQVMSIYTANAQNASEYKTEGDNTYLAVTRPDSGYLGGTEFGVILYPNKLMVDGTSYVFEATLMLEGATGDVVIVAKKALLSQKLEYIRYNFEDGTIDGLNGAVYGVTADDLANGLNVAIVVSDVGQWYQIYVNGALVSDTIAYTSDFFHGFELDTIEILATGSGETVFGVDNIMLYEADEPADYEGDKELAYVTYTLVSGEKVSIKALAATGCTHSFTEKTVAATCTTAGYVLKECSGCGGQQIEDEVAPTKHSFDEENAEIVPPTCYESGYKITTCTKCGTKNGEVVATAKGHTHASDAEYIKATCTSNAFTKGDCVDCGTYFEYEHLGTKLTHELGDNAVVTLPTCSSDGYTSGPCKHCGKDYVDPNSTVGKFDHYYFELKEHVVAGCDTQGYDKFICLSCNQEQTINQVNSTGHKTYYSSSTKDGATVIKYHCTRCTYSFEYTVNEIVPDYNAMSKALGDRLTLSYYQDSLTNKTSLLSDGGDYNESGSGKFKNGQWRNIDNNSFGRFVAAAGGSDAYINFPDGDQGLKVNTVWEFDVKFPAEGVGDDANPQYANGGVNLNFSTNGADGAGFDPMKIYPDGSVVMNNLQEGYAGFSSIKYASNKTTWDIPLAPVGTVNSETWTRIAIVLNFTNKTYTCYVNGVAGQTLSLPSDFAVKVRYIRFNFMKTGEVSAMEFCNMYYYKGDMPVYMVALEAITDVMGTEFGRDENGAPVPTTGYQNVEDLYGDLSIATKQKFFTELKENKLNIKYGSSVTTAGFAQTGTDSHIYGDVSACKDSAYTVRTEVRFNGGAYGSYDILRLVRGAASLPIVYINDRKICVYGSEYTKEITPNSLVKFDVVVRDGGNGNNFDLYIDGVLVAEKISYAESAYGKASNDDLDIKLFNINDGSDAIDITVSHINVFKGDVVPSYYAGMVTGYDAPGYKDTVISFNGNEKIADILPKNTKLPGGYYYENIADQSYLSLAIAPMDQKVVGNVRYTTADKVNGALGVEGGFNTITVSDFKTNGVLNLTFDNLFGLPIGQTGYDISAYSRMITRFYVNDATAGYKFKVVLDGASDDYTVFENSFATGWHVVETDISAAGDYIVAIKVIFEGVDGEAELDGFRFSLESISFETDGYTIESTDTVEGGEYIYNPAKIKQCADNHTYGDKTEVPATCDKHGYTFKVCSGCGYKELTIIDRTGHKFDTEVATGGQLPTCESEGAMLYECACGAMSAKFLPKTQHNFVLDESATEADGKKQATCTEDGVDIYVCTNESCDCGDRKFGLTVEAIGHAPAADATQSEKVPTTCTEDGTNTVSKCAHCGEAYDIPVKAIGHSYKEVIIPADCLKDGESYKKCASCGDVIDYTVLTAKGHTVPAKYLHTRVETTCTNAAGWKYNCLVCGEVGYLVDEGATPKPHTWGDWTVVTPNTCGDDGHREKYCEECGGKISELGTDAEKKECFLEAAGNHTWNTEWSYSDDFAAGVRGEKWHDCDVCDDIKDLNGAGTEGLVFVYNNNGAYVITDYIGSETEVIVPAIFKGQPVIIGSAFTGNKAITSVTIADGVQLSAGVFAGCTSLAEVKLPAGITMIPTDAFSGCRSLVSIELPASCTEIRTGAFYNCESLEEITINGELTSVQIMAFKGCDKLARVYYVTDKVPAMKIAEIGNEAFLAAVWAEIAE